MVHLLDTDPLSSVQRRRVLWTPQVVLREVNGGWLNRRAVHHILDRDSLGRSLLRLLQAMVLAVWSGSRDATLSREAADSQMETGATRYLDNCSACHASSGGGAAWLFPALCGSDDPATLIRAVLQAVSTSTAPTGTAMPALGWRLTDSEIADVLTYTRNAWGNTAPVTADAVGSARSRLANTRRICRMPRALLRTAVVAPLRRLASA